MSTCRWEIPGAGNSHPFLTIYCHPCNYATVGAAARRFCTDVTVVYTMEIPHDLFVPKHSNYQTFMVKFKG